MTKLYTLGLTILPEVYIFDDVESDSKTTNKGDAK